MEGRGATVTYLWESGWAPFGVLWNSTGQPAASRPGGLLARRACRSPSSSSGARTVKGTLLALAAQIEAARPWVLHRPRDFDC